MFPVNPDARVDRDRSKVSQQVKSGPMCGGSYTSQQTRRPTKRGACADRENVPGALGLFPDELQDNIVVHQLFLPETAGNNKQIEWRGLCERLLWCDDQSLNASNRDLSASTCGMWKRSMVRIVRHRQPKGPATDRPNLTHRAKFRLYHLDSIRYATKDNLVHSAGRRVYKDARPGRQDVNPRGSNGWPSERSRCRLRDPVRDRYVWRRV